jgi:hypothetical protein
MTRWLSHPEPLTANAGHNRFVWDLRWPRPSMDTYEYTSAVVPGLGTEAKPAGPLVMPGEYRVRLTVGATSELQPLRVILDPRERVAPEALAAQFTLAQQIGAAMTEASSLARCAQALRTSLAAARARQTTSGGDQSQLAVEHTLDSLKVGSTLDGLASLQTSVQGADRMPTAAMQAVYRELRAELTAERGQWSATLQARLPDVHSCLETPGAAPLPAPSR